MENLGEEYRQCFYTLALFVLTLLIPINTYFILMDTLLIPIKASLILNNTQFSLQDQHLTQQLKQHLVQHQSTVGSTLKKLLSLIVLFLSMTLTPFSLSVHSGLNARLSELCLSRQGN